MTARHIPKSRNYSGDFVHFHLVPFIKKAHEGQTRKYTHEPYYIHPMRVYEILRFKKHMYDYDISDASLVTALLHDVIEDTDYDIYDVTEFLKKECLFTMDEIAKIVKCLYGVTKATIKSFGTRKERSKMEIEYLRHCSCDVAVVKLADIIDNCKDIVKLDPKFAKVYLKEKLECVDVLCAAPREFVQDTREFLLGQSELL